MSEELVSFKRKDWEYFCSKINWGASFLDARAITIMNEPIKGFGADDIKKIISDFFDKNQTMTCANILKLELLECFFAPDNKSKDFAEELLKAEKKMMKENVILGNEGLEYKKKADKQ